MQVWAPINPLDDPTFLGYTATVLATFIGLARGIYKRYAGLILFFLCFLVWSIGLTWARYLYCTDLRGRDEFITSTFWFLQPLLILFISGLVTYKSFTVEKRRRQKTFRDNKWPIRNAYMMCIGALSDIRNTAIGKHTQARCQLYIGKLQKQLAKLESEISNGFKSKSDDGD